MNSFILFLVLVNILLLTMYKKPQYSVIMILLSLVLFFMIIHYKNYRENFTTLEKCAFSDFSGNHNDVIWYRQILCRKKY